MCLCTMYIIWKQIVPYRCIVIYIYTWLTYIIITYSLRGLDKYSSVYNFVYTMYVYVYNAVWYDDTRELSMETFVTSLLSAEDSVRLFTEVLFKKSQLNPNGLQTNYFSIISISWYK